MASDRLPSPVKNLVECPVCFEQMLEARMLPCGHRLCGDCCVKIERSEGFSMIVCPHCRSKYSKNQIIKDFALSKYVETLSLKSGSHNDVEKSDIEEKEESVPPELTHPCCSCTKHVVVNELFGCLHCPNGVVGFFCALCAVNLHRNHNVFNGIEAQTRSLEDINNLKINLNPLDRLGGRHEQKKAFMKEVLTVFEQNRVKLANDINGGFVHASLEQIDKLKQCYSSFQELIEQFCKETESKWEQTCNQIVTNIGVACELDHFTLTSLRNDITNDQLSFKQIKNEVTRHSEPPPPPPVSTNMFSPLPAQHAARPMTFAEKQRISRRRKN